MPSSPSPAARTTAPPRRVAEVGYWLLPAVLTAAQAFWIVRSLPIVRFEEVAEGARNAWWLRDHALFDGISTNVGWYAGVLAASEITGDALFAARWLKLALYAGAVLCLAWVLRRRWGRGGALGPGAAAVPLLAMGLSPSVLYFGTVGASFGTDLLALPFLLAILALGRERRLDAKAGQGGGAPDPLLHALFGFVAMVAWTAYPVFLFYLPGLVLAWALLWVGAGEEGRLSVPALGKPAVPALAGFLTPLVLAAAWLREPGRLFHDPATGSGLFRGGGTGFDFDPVGIARHVGIALRDLFVRGTSYYYWVEAPDLSGVLGVGAALAVAFGCVLLWRRVPDDRLWIAVALLLPALNLLAVSAGTGPQGLRRSTTLLAGLYLLYTLVWRRARSRRVLAAFLLFLPLHHVVSAVQQVPLLGTAGTEQTHLWLRVEPTAEASLDHWLERTAETGVLDCREAGLPAERCQYGGIWALLSGHRAWNGLPEVPLRGWSYAEGRFVALSVEELSGEFSP